MPIPSRFLDDIAKLANSTAGTIAGIRNEAETLSAQRLARKIERMNLVDRSEFEAMQDMLSKARLEQEIMKKEMEEIRKTLAELQQN